MKNRAGFRPGDFVVILLCIALAFGSFIMIKAHSGGKKVLVIQAMGKEYTYPLDQDATYQIQGRLGVSVIEVSEGNVRFLESPCPTKSCVQHAAISSAGQWTACLPNEVLVQIQGEDTDGVDALSF